jgi:sugar/nucleoside kinase (ribokinase family)
MIGADAFGDLLISRLSGVGVDTQNIARSAEPTATTVVLVDRSGNRMFLHRLGASADAFAQPVQFASSVINGISHCHLASVFGLPRLRPHTADLLHRARAAGLTTSVDTQWDTRGRWMEDLAPCLSATDLLFMNEDEARMLTGSPDPATAAKKMREHGAGVVVVKLGGRGCMVVSADNEFECPAFNVPVVDTTGAGDCFAGAFLAARLRGLSYPQSARFANAVGALAIQKLGAIEGVRSFEETEEWIRSVEVAVCD